MAAKAQHPFYHSVSILAHRLPEQQGNTCDLALLIAAELASTQDAPVGRKILSANAVSTDTVLAAINQHVPDNGTAENALLRSGLEMLLFRALYDLRHSAMDIPDSFVTGIERTPGRSGGDTIH